MKIYKIRAWTNKTVQRGKKRGNIEHPYSKEIIIIDNLESAKRVFESEAYNIRYEISDADRGFAELFEPHIFQDGTLAYWPDNDQYIDKYPQEDV
jgi:hypothetical protein